MKDAEVDCTHGGTVLCSSVYSFAAAWKTEHMDEPYIHFPSSEEKPLLPFLGTFAFVKVRRTSKFGN